MLKEVLNEIGRRDRFLLTSHARPDGDAVGSVLACWQILRQLGKEAQVVMADPVPVIYRPLPFADSIVQACEIHNGFDAAIILECDSVQRTRLQGLDGRFLINIDHHSSARPFAHINWIDPHACATAEMVYRLARQAGVPISPEIATCLYTAVLTDTGSFSFIGTNEHTFSLARELVLCGADPARIAQGVYFSHPTSKMRLLGAALSNLHREGKVSWMWVTREHMARSEANDEDCEGLVNYALAIEGVEVSIFFRELPDHRYRVSLRSKGDVNVARVAEHFGGGGHDCASGCSIDGPLSVAVARIMEQLRLNPTVQ
ncbi:MAG TPA: bifunctional oligoribonuclease/PAP phosphatase NrnA [Terriglobales bacterium]|jgi:bifunctional oligoribonuclease and PAP phosphatase NrnA|nr:bifunctional oligoribonuclease/PAP phosphatase NrnA [Terriglobales bacterium]